MKLARFILLFFLVPFVNYGQNISSINITDSINCYGDFECVDIDINNLNSSISYDLWIWRDIGGGEFSQLTSIIEDITSSSDFNSTGVNSGTFNYCFELNGDYTIEIMGDDGSVIEAFGLLKYGLQIQILYNYLQILTFYATVTIMVL